MPALSSTADLVRDSVSKVYGESHDGVQMMRHIQQATLLVEDAERKAKDARDSLPEDCTPRARADEIIGLRSLYESNLDEFRQTMEIYDNEIFLREQILVLPEVILSHFVNVMHLVADNTEVWLGDPESPSRKPNLTRILCENALRRISYWNKIIPSILILPEPQPRPSSNIEAQGAHAFVYKVVWQGQVVAQKILNHFPNTEDAERAEKDKKLYLREMVVWRQLAHSNINPLLGIQKWDVPEKSQRFCMVSPWAHRGTLRSVLYADADTLNPLVTLTKIANALSYLHDGHIPAMAHGDIHSANVLIGENFEPLLTDFGLSRFSPNVTMSSTGGNKGNVRYKAPEMLGKRDWDPTPEADIYAFAMLCLEVYSKERPWKNIPDKTAEFKVPRLVEAGRRPDRPTQTNRAIFNGVWDVIEGCWKQEACARTKSTRAWEIMVELSRN